MQVKCVVVCIDKFVPVTVDCTNEEFESGVHFDRARASAFLMGYDDAGRVYDEFEPVFSVFRHLFEGEPVTCCE